MSDYAEANFDGLVGPTHHFAGLSLGNLASTEHGGDISYPKKAALQGLHKMKILHDLGIPQGVIPPLFRPTFRILKRLGFKGSHKEILEKASSEDPTSLSACNSSSSMWCANSGTITPSSDTHDRKIHFTPANLITHFHRAIETEETAKLFAFLFQGPSFIHHPPLPSTLLFADEGAANHIRLSLKPGFPGIHLFVWGKGTQSFPGRQTKASGVTIVRCHQIKNALHFEQTPEAIAAGVFHNDVISTGHHHFFLYHEKAFVEPFTILEEAFLKLTKQPLKSLCVLNSELSLEESVKTYLFNSQLITTSEGKTILIAAIECLKNSKTQQLISTWIKDPSIPINDVFYIDLDESMKNGGGPACLRIRMELTQEELKSVHPGIWLNEQLFERLGGCIETHYRDVLHIEDLRSDKLAREAHSALKEIYQILNINGGFLC